MSIDLDANESLAVVATEAGVHILRRLPSGTWTQEAVLTGLDILNEFSALYGYGWSCSIDKNIVAVGAWGRGFVHVFRNDGSTWSEVSKLAPSDGVYYRSGSSLPVPVAIEGTRALVGSLASGGAYIFENIDTIGDDCDANLLDDDCDVLAGVTANCNENLSPDACDIEAGLSLDEDGNGIPDECCFDPQPPQLETILDRRGKEVGLTKVRALAITVGSANVAQAIRVTIINLPAPFDIADGSRMWVGEPFVVCENTGQTDINNPDVCGPVPNGAPQTTTYAELQCDPLYRDWSGNGVINVIGELVIPNGTFDMQVIDIGCPTVIEGNYSDPLTVTTSRWGDVTGSCADYPCSPPDGTVDVVTDVTSILQGFTNTGGGGKARSDLEPGKVDFLIGISDVVFALNAFQGDAYPFSVPQGWAPSPCGG